MDFSTLLGIAFILICILFIFLLIAISKINNLHKKVTDVNPNDLYPFMEELRELVIESERVADKLEDAVNKKEELLEDLSALLDDKLKRLETIQDEPELNMTYSQPSDTYSPPNNTYAPLSDTYTPSSDAYTSSTTYSPSQTMRPHSMPTNTSPAGNMRSRIADMVDQGYNDLEIAAKLGISTTEVLIVKQMDLG
ncbi:MAG: hypothetical protein C0603_08360 [Denitrovibrio sp.]|nr:MAG: hypothetical protein C0603_08360 [Denitrovibrio sp.]